MKKLFLPIIVIFLSSCSTSEVPIEKEVVDPNPQERVAYNTNVKKIMDSNCVSCHSGGSPSGGLLLTTYNNVKKAGESGKLITRMNSTSNPMPPNGILPSSTRSIIDKWKADGFLEN